MKRKRSRRKVANNIVALKVLAVLAVFQIITIGLIHTTTITSVAETTSAEVVVGVAPGEDNAPIAMVEAEMQMPVLQAEPVPTSDSPIIIASESTRSNIGPGVVEEASLVKDEEETKSYTEEDLQYMIMVLTGECQNRSVEIQKKYGSVVLNRVSSNKYPNSVKEVCLQRGQYSSFRDGNAYRTPTQETIEAATWLLENGSVYPEYVVYQSRGKQGKGVYEVVKGEYFCY